MNPYKILRVNQTSTKSEIIQAVAMAMRERKYDCKEIAEAQRRLMHPVFREVDEFMHLLNPIPARAKSPSSLPQLAKLISVSELTYQPLKEWENE